jgi:hypothetical protein
VNHVVDYALPSPTEVLDAQARGLFGIARSDGLDDASV